MLLKNTIADGERYAPLRKKESSKYKEKRP